MTPLESLMLETIPERLPPAPRHLDGPTARWMAEHPDEILCNAVGYTTPSARLGKALKSLGDNK